MKAAADAGVKWFIFASSMLVYAGGTGKVIDRNTNAMPSLGYGKAKLDAEVRLTKLAGEAGVSLGIIRLPHVYGARNLIFGQISRGRVFLPGAGKNMFSHLYVTDAARILVSAAEIGWHGTCPVADDLPVTWDDFLIEIKRYYPRLRDIRIPMPIALLGTLMLTPLRRLFPNPSLSTPEAVKAWNMTMLVKSGLLEKELGLELQYPTFREGIPAALDACLNLRWVHSIYDRRR